MAGRRLRTLLTHVTSSSVDPAPDLLTDEDIKSFIKTGYLILTPDRLGLSVDVHHRIHQRGLDFVRKASNEIQKGGMVSENVNSTVPEVSCVLQNSVVLGALRSLLGNGCTLHPHTFVHTSGTNIDQDFHKDGALPWNGHAFRHHRPEWLLLMYYPTEVSEEVGPTEILPGTQYWHYGPQEEGYPIGGRLIGPGISADKELKRRDARRSKAISELSWPSFAQPVRVTVPAGSVVFTHFDVFHRGTRRQASADARGLPPRLMFKFWYLRCEEPLIPTWAHVPAEDDMCPQAFRQGPPQLQEVWRTTWNWMCGGACRVIEARLKHPMVTLPAQNCALQLRGGVETESVGAAYCLAALGSAGVTVLREALFTMEDDEGSTRLRRTAAYGLEACGEASVYVFLEGAQLGRGALPRVEVLAGKRLLPKTLDPLGHRSLRQPVHSRDRVQRDIRALSAWGLGKVAPATPEVCAALVSLLTEDQSEFVRSTAAEAIAFFGRRLGPKTTRNVVTAVLKVLEDVPVETSDRFQAVPMQDFNQGEQSPFTAAVLQSMPGPLFRSGVREHAAQALLAMIPSVQTMQPSMEEEVLRVLGTIIFNERNRYVHGFAFEALRRLTLHRHSTVSMQLLQRFLEPGGEASMRWIPPEAQMALQMEQSFFDKGSRLYVRGPVDASA